MKIYFLLLVIVNGMLSCENAEPETYLIPKGFTGIVNVIFNQANGEDIKYEDGRRLYKIPTNGILLTKFSDQEGIYDHKYYYYDSIGDKKTLLKIFAYDYNKDGSVKWLVEDSTQVGIFDDGITGVYGSNKFRYQQFIVSDKKSLDSIDSPNNNFHNKLKSYLHDDFGNNSKPN